jgi:FkbM family methyltransferase
VLISKLLGRFRKKNSSTTGFYPVAASCQIEKLSTIYEQYFGKIVNGTFVEIGAFDGEYTSNTSGLADIGWRGVYVEPVPDFYEQCKKRHLSNKNVSVVNTAVGAEEGTVKIHVGGPLSTVDPKIRDVFSELEWAKSSFVDDSVCEVKVKTLNALLEQENVQPGFDLLVVDVEGYEWNVLQGFNIEHWAPKMVIIELHDQNDDYWAIRKECVSIVGYFDSAGYKVIWKDFTNTIYVPTAFFPLQMSSR